MTEAGWSVCAECGMGCNAGEYHPYAACLMFKQCRNSETVRANLQGVRDDSFQQGRVAARDKLDELISEYNGNFNAAWDEWAKWINTQQAQDEKGVGE